MGSRFIASRMRCSMNHADLAVRPYLRSISRAATPFLLDAHLEDDEQPGPDRDLGAVEDRAGQH